MIEFKIFSSVGNKTDIREHAAPGVTENSPGNGGNSGQNIPRRGTLFCSLLNPRYPTERGVVHEIILCDNHRPL
jgi:hypothetical protein